MSGPRFIKGFSEKTKLLVFSQTKSTIYFVWLNTSNSIFSERMFHVKHLIGKAVTSNKKGFLKMSDFYEIMYRSLRKVNNIPSQEIPMIRCGQNIVFQRPSDVEKFVVNICPALSDFNPVEGNTKDEIILLTEYFHPGYVQSINFQELNCLDHSLEFLTDFDARNYFFVDINPCAFVLSHYHCFTSFIERLTTHKLFYIFKTEFYRMEKRIECIRVFFYPYEYDYFDSEKNIYPITCVEFTQALYYFTKKKTYHYWENFLAYIKKENYRNIPEYF